MKQCNFLDVFHFGKGQVGVATFKEEETTHNGVPVGRFIYPDGYSPGWISLIEARKIASQGGLELEIS